MRSIVFGLSFSAVSLLAVQAAVINVPANQPTIQAGINAAASGDTVLVADGTYMGIGNRDIDFGGKNVVLKSANGPDFTIIDCEGDSAEPHRGFRFHSGEDSSSVIEGFTIQGGYVPDTQIREEGGGAINTVAASPKIVNCKFLNNYAGYVGGAIVAVGGVSFVVEGCFFQGNSAQYGGGIYCWQKPSQVINSLFYQNMVSQDGAAVFRSTTSPGLIQRCVFAENEAGVKGIVLSSQSSTTTIESCTFVLNRASGGITYSVYSALILDRTIIAFNRKGRPVGYGGGLYPNAYCCDFFGNNDGDRGNFNNFSCIFFNPQLCDKADGDYQIATTSPCAPANNSCGVLIGAKDTSDCVYTYVCVDSDGDSLGDPGHPENDCVDDNCPLIYNPNQEDADNDDVGNLCDTCTDIDGDGFGNPDFPANTCILDNCPYTFNPDQADSNGNGIGDSCEFSGESRGDVTLKVSNLGGTSLLPPGPLYIGQDNILQFWWANASNLYGFTTGFRFESTLPYNWVANYGSKPTAGCGSFCKIVKTEPAAVGWWDITGGVAVSVGKLPDSLLLGGAAPGYGPCPASPSRLCYSMKLHIPFSPDSIGSKTFCIDNIFYPPAGTWEFAEVYYNYPPDYQGNVNHSWEVPDAPDVCFEIRRFPGDANGDGIANITDIVYIFSYMTRGGPPPIPYSTGDYNCNSIVNIADVVYLVQYIFNNGPAPCPPD